MAVAFRCEFIEWVSREGNCQLELVPLELIIVDPRSEKLVPI